MCGNQAAKSGKRQVASVSGNSLLSLRACHDAACTSCMRAATSGITPSSVSSSVSWKHQVFQTGSSLFTSTSPWLAPSALDFLDFLDQARGPNNISDKVDPHDGPGAAESAESLAFEAAPAPPASPGSDSWSASKRPTLPGQLSAILQRNDGKARQGGEKPCLIQN